MKFTTRVKHAVNAFNEKEKVTNSRGLATDFLRNGNKNKTMLQDWSQVEMSDQDMYTGYSYAAIKKRANRASSLGRKFLYTEASKQIQEAAKKQDIQIKHPYLQLVEKSKEFTKRKFWHDISTYLDLEGVYYLMAVRAISNGKNGETKVGKIQKLSMLNPYMIRKVIKESDGTVGGYVESRAGLYREIPKEMIIEIRLLNPFDNEKPFSMTDAAKESQFTMKQAGDYTRHSIKGNINSPGAITTDVELDDNVFDNFVSRIQNHSKGEPLYGNGSGAINWSSMQIDLDKAALDKINEIHRSILFAVSGTSKTTLGIEESGTTRDTSQVQKDNFTEDAVMPQVEDIIDALNLDYRKWYPEWEKDEYEILLDNPLESNREAELKDIEIREAELTLRESLIGMGYEYEIASKYARGDIPIDELGEPTLEPEISDEQASAIAAQELGLTSPEEQNTEPSENKITRNNLATNQGVGNPYRDSKGQFADSPFGPKPKMAKRGTNKKKIEKAKEKLNSEKEAEGDENTAYELTNATVDKMTAINKKLEKATSGSEVGKLVAQSRKVAADYLEANGGDIEKFKKIDEDWVGNDYKTLENHLENGDSKELGLMQDLQQSYFKRNKITEVTVYRGIYNKQAKSIKQAVKNKESVSVGPDWASSFTGYDTVARDYADGAAFTAPDEISSSVVIKKTFNVKDVAYSTQVAPFFAGNTNDEFVISTPKGYTINPSDIEVIK